MPVDRFVNAKSEKWSEEGHSFGSRYDRYVRLTFIGTFLLAVLVIANGTVHVTFGPSLWRSIA